MNQLLNASGVLAALQAVRGQLPVSAQDIRRGLSLVEMPGRFQVLPGQPTIILDVGHNPHAAGHLVANLGNMAYHPATYAVFGMLSDKDIDGVIAHLANHVDHWICCDLPGPRGTTARMLADHLHMAGIDDLVDRRKGIDRSVVCSTTPDEGLRLARRQAGPDDRIIVFGSFLTVALALPAVREDLSATPPSN